MLLVVLQAVLLSQSPTNYLKDDELACAVLLERETPPEEARHPQVGINYVFGRLRDAERSNDERAAKLMPNNKFMVPIMKCHKERIKVECFVPDVGGPEYGVNAKPRSQICHPAHCNVGGGNFKPHATLVTSSIQCEACKTKSGAATEAPQLNCCCDASFFGNENLHNIPGLPYGPNDPEKGKEGARIQKKPLSGAIADSVKEAENVKKDFAAKRKQFVTENKS